MTRPLDFHTSDLELAASLMTAVNRKPEMIAPGTELVEFFFPANEATQAVVMKYAAGTLFQEVRRLAANRSWLYRQVREVVKHGRAVRP